jgi:acid phosphatase
LLTSSGGLDDSVEHGEDFRGVYHSLLHFLPSADEKDKYAFRVTNNVITTQTLSGFAKGLYPKAKEYPA